MIQVRLTLLLGIALLLGACSSLTARSTGFLSDYASLSSDGEATLSYFNPANGLKNYSSFIIEPTIVHVHDDTKGDINAAQSAELTKYMDTEIRAALAGAYSQVSQPGPGVARIRVAITDLDKTSPVLNIIPISMIIGTGLGGLAIEAEIVDSVSGEQVGAIVDSIKGSRLSSGNFTQLGNAKSAIEQWSKRLRLRLDEAHGRQGG